MQGVRVQQTRHEEANRQATCAQGLEYPPEPRAHFDMAERNRGADGERGIEWRRPVGLDAIVQAMQQQ
jgi:hypothetical protein